MARARTNAITSGYSGRLDNVIFTSDHNIRSRPDVSKRVWSPKQKEHLGQFEKAKEYARKVISDPELNEFYARKAKRKPGLGARHLALSDACHPPEIKGFSFSGFIGRRGDTIRFEAYDDFRVTGD